MRGIGLKTDSPFSKLAVGNLPQIASKFKSSAQGIALGKKLFLPGTQANVQPTEIAGFLGSVGIAPKEMQISVAAAQVLYAGGAFANTASKATSIGQVLKPGLGTLNAVTNFLGSVGLLDPNSPVSKVVNFGTNLFMLFAVPGLNILAAIGAVVNMIFEVFFPPDDRPKVRAELGYENSVAIAAWYKNEIVQNKKTILEEQQNYLNGKSSVFQMMGNIAEKAPILFPHFFPELKMFIPPQTISKCITSEREAGYGGFLGLFRSYDMVRETTCAEYQAVKVTGKLQLAEAFIRRYIFEPFAPYFLIQQMPESVMRTYGYPPASRIESHPNPIYPRIPVSDLALLSLFPPYFKRIEDTFDLSGFLYRLNITPSELGYGNLLESELGYQGYYSERKSERLPAVSFNGVDYFETSDARYNAKVKKDNLDIERILQADRVGDAKTLYNIVPAAKIVHEFGILPYVTPQMSKQCGRQLEVIAPDLQKLDYRNIENVWACYSVLNQLKADPFFQDAIGRQGFSFLGRLNSDSQRVEERFYEIYYTVVAKEMNKQARQNIADLFGMPADKIEIGYRENGLAYVKNSGG